jgi:hypothetical protein
MWWTLKTVVAALIAIFISLSAIASETWAYRYPVERNSGFSISKDLKKIEIGNLILNAEFCKKSDPYICVETESLNFAVPRNLSVTDKSAWSHGSHKYEAVLIRVPLRVLGRDIKIYQIDSPTQNPKMRFYYSKERGLIGAKVLDHDEKALLLLEEACGFGAPGACASK